MSDTADLEAARSTFIVSIWLFSRAQRSAKSLYAWTSAAARLQELAAVNAQLSHKLVVGSSVPAPHHPDKGVRYRERRLLTI
jgi:hypothetical protein